VLRMLEGLLATDPWRLFSACLIRRQGGRRKGFDKRQADNVVEVTAQVGQHCPNFGGLLTNKRMKNRMVLESRPVKVRSRPTAATGLTGSRGFVRLCLDYPSTIPMPRDFGELAAVGA